MIINGCFNDSYTKKWVLDNFKFDILACITFFRTDCETSSYNILTTLDCPFLREPIAMGVWVMGPVLPLSYKVPGMGIYYYHFNELCYWGSNPQPPNLKVTDVTVTPERVYLFYLDTGTQNQTVLIHTPFFTLPRTPSLWRFYTIQSALPCFNRLHCLHQDGDVQLSS